MVFTRSIFFVLLAWRSISGVSMTEPSHPSSQSERWKAFFFDVRLPSSGIQKVDGEIFEDTKSPSELYTARRHYKELADGILRQISMAHEVASRTEALLFPHRMHACHKDETSRTRKTSSPEFFSCKLEKKIAAAASTLEQNVFALEELLKPISVTVGMPPFQYASTGVSTSVTTVTFPMNSSPSNSDDVFLPPGEGLDGDPNHLPMQPVARYIPPYKPGKDNDLEGEEAPYDTASHVITHLARDWTADGASIRRDTHDWIVDQIWDFHDKRVEEQSSRLDPEHLKKSPLSPVLVPGAGMARLAFDIAFGSTEDTAAAKVYPFTVEAIDNSLVVATAACHILHRCARTDTQSKEGNSSLKVFPFAADPYLNEVDPYRRWQSAEFPEEEVLDKFLSLQKQQSSSWPKLSYLIGDFVGTYATPSKCGVYGSIATCFFIDTATNIYEYIVTIRNLLRAGGVWINLGPVQWHSNAQLQPSTSELKDILVMSGFQIIRWEISESILAYRHPDDITKGTRVEAYRPLKFVAVREGDDDFHGTRGSLLSAMEALRYTTGRRSPGFAKNGTQSS